MKALKDCPDADAYSNGRKEPAYRYPDGDCVPVSFLIRIAVLSAWPMRDGKAPTNQLPPKQCKDAGGLLLQPSDFKGLFWAAIRECCYQVGENLSSILLATSKPKKGVYIWDVDKRKP